MLTHYHLLAGIRKVRKPGFLICIYGVRGTHIPHPTESGTPYQPSAAVFPAANPKAAQTHRPISPSYPPGPGLRRGHIQLNSADRRGRSLVALARRSRSPRPRCGKSRARARSGRGSQLCISLLLALGVFGVLRVLVYRTGSVARLLGGRFARIRARQSPVTSLSVWTIQGCQHL